MSFDGGSTWQVVPIPGITDCTGGPWERASDPWLSFSPDGTLHQLTLAFQADPPPNRPGGFGPNALMVSKSIDGGLTWSAPIALIQDDDPRVLNDKPALSADPTDARFVYAVWDRLQISGAEAVRPENLGPGRGLFLGIGLGFKGPVLFARSTDGGNSWEAARTIYEPGANNQTIGNQIVVQPDGTVVDVFTEILNFKNRDKNGFGYNANLALLRSIDKGASWLPHSGPIRAAQILSNGAVTPNLGVPVRDAFILFDVAVDPASGALYAVWQDARFEGFDQIAFTMSNDGGFTWSAPIRVSQTPYVAANPLRSQGFVPSVAVSADGIVTVTYYDFRNDDSSGELADKFAVFCAIDCADPARWGGELRLTNASFDLLQAPFARGLFLGDYQGLAADALGHFLSGFSMTGPGADPASVFFRRSTP